MAQEQGACRRPQRHGAAATWFLQRTAALRQRGGWDRCGDAHTRARRRNKPFSDNGKTVPEI